MNEHKIYLLKTHLKTENDEYLYKIGRSTQQHLKRLSDYPKTYKVILTRACIDCIYVENKLIKLFTKKYKKEFKNEYFVGDENEMINDINKIINGEQDNNDNKPKETEIKFVKQPETTNLLILDSLQVMSDNQNHLDKIREQNKVRQERFYKTNKEAINARRRELYKLGRAALKTEKITKNIIDTNVKINEPIKETTENTVEINEPIKETIENTVEINEPMVYDYIPYNDDDIDYLYKRSLDDIITDEVEWLLFPKELTTIIENDGKRYINLAKKMCHSVRTQWTYRRFGNKPKRQIVYIKLVYKYIYDHKMCLDNFF